MKNVTVSMDESLLAKARDYAEQQGVSLNSLIRQLLRRAVGEYGNSRVSEFLQVAESVKGNSNGWKWDREELQRG